MPSGAAVPGDVLPTAPGRVRIPVEVRSPAVVFDVVSRGYDRRQVAAHVAALEQSVAELRWDHDELAGQRRLLERDRAEFDAERERWRPSFSALGEAAEQILALADGEAATLVAAAAETARQVREDADTQARAMRRQLAQETEQARRQADAEIAALEQSVEQRRQVLAVELAHARRDAELHATGLLAKANAQAEQTVAAARRRAQELLAGARATLAETARDRDRLTTELVELAGRLNGVVERIAAPGPRGSAGALPAGAPQAGARSGTGHERVTVSLLDIDD